MVGTRREDIISAASSLLDDKSLYDQMAKAVNPYGDGQASRRIAQAILYWFGLSDREPEVFAAGGGGKQ
jgi:UDP-N-acetylglucosamine 2-epimerase